MRFYFLLAAATFFTSCGPKVISIKPLNDVGYIAILPVKAESDIRRERVKYLENSLTRELEGSGYVILNPEIVSETCSSSECPEKKLIESRYGVKTFAALEVETASRSNFIAGYYNNVSGNLKLLDSSSSQLMRIEHSQSERGGLIFNSGQIFQGIRGTIDNYGDDKFSALADQFVREVVRKLPKLNPKSDNESFYINSLSLNPRSGSFYDVCLSGTPRVGAKLLLGQRAINLREVNPGNYCSVVPLGWLIMPRSEVKAELRSAFGNSLTKNLDTINLGLCDPAKYLSFKDGEFQLCKDKQCESENANCGSAKFLIFAADSSAGPYKKISELPSAKALKKISGRNIAVVALSKDGSISLPIIYGAK